MSGLRFRRHRGQDPNGAVRRSSGARCPDDERDVLLGRRLARLDLPGHRDGFWQGLDEALADDDHGRDDAIGDRLRRLPLPAHQRGFWPALEATLAAQTPSNSGGGRSRRVWARIVAAAAVAAAATILAAVWLGLPDATSGGLSRALARGFLPPLQTTTSAARVDGGRLVWTSRRATNPTTGVYDVNLFALDLRTGETRAVSTSPSWKQLAAVGGGRVAWVDAGGGADTLYVADLTSGETRRVAAIGPRRTPAAAPDIALSDDLVAWVDQRHGHGDLYVGDLACGFTIPVCVDRWGQSQPALAGDVVVWVDDRDDGWGTDGVHYLNGTDLFARDLTDGRTFAVCTAPDDQLSPAVSGSIVVWQDGRHRTPSRPDDWDVYGYDLRTGREFVVAGGPGAQLHPAISGDTVLWTQRYRSAGRTLSMIMGRDLRSGRSFEVSEAARYDYASISGSTAVWCTLGHGDVPVAVFGAKVMAHAGRPLIETLQP